MIRPLLLSLGLLVSSLAFMLPSQQALAATCPVLPSSLKGTLTLPVGCNYTLATPIYIHSSNATLDCQGATITYKKNPDIKGNMAVQINSPNGAPISNVTVKNCNFINAGIVVRAATNFTALDKSDPNKARANSPRNVLIQNVSIKNADRVAIYLHHYVVGVTLDKVKIEKANGVCVYLDAFSQKHTIKNSTFTGCGGGKKAEGGKFDREGLAIDGSMHNTLINNTFSGNKAGGIFLYKNCWEHYKTSTNPRRTEPSAYNIIKNNTFINEKVGIAVASRQAKDQSGLECGDPKVYAKYDKKLAGYFLDPAPNNTIEGNTFTKVAHGIWIQDDNTKVLGNTFSGVKTFLTIGTKLRSQYLKKPVNNTQVIDNTTTDKISTFNSRVKIVYGSTNTAMLNNKVGKPVPPKPDPKPDSGIKALKFSCTNCHQKIECPSLHVITSLKAACSSSQVDIEEFKGQPEKTILVTKASKASSVTCELGSNKVTTSKSIKVPANRRTLWFGCKSAKLCHARAQLTCKPR